MADHAVPEMLRTPLEELVLAVKSLSPNAEAAAFAARAIQPPPARAVANAIDLLVAVGALRRSDETLTALGAHLVSLPVAPRLGKMLVVAAALGQLEPALTVAAATATRGFFILPPDAKRAADASRRAFAGDAASDHVATARAFEEWRSVFAKRGARARRARFAASAFCPATRSSASPRCGNSSGRCCGPRGSRVASRPRARPLHRPLWTSRCSEPWRAPACSQKSPPCPDGGAASS